MNFILFPLVLYFDSQSIVWKFWIGCLLDQQRILENAVFNSNLSTNVWMITNRTVSVRLPDLQEGDLVNLLENNDSKIQRIHYSYMVLHLLLELYNILSIIFIHLNWCIFYCAKWIYSTAMHWKPICVYHECIIKGHMAPLRTTHWMLAPRKEKKTAIG